jgi:uncharacterized membrane protein YraQ (UPF0718 family)
MNWLIILTLFSVALSFFADKQKTITALKISLQKMISILPAFTLMLILVAIALYFFTPEQIQNLMDNDNVYHSMILASLAGSLAYMPGFIAFPLCGILLDSGVKYMVISAFSSTLMMVGIITFPVEKEYLGIKLGIIRNLLSLLIALIVAIFTGLFYGELF